jgi:putative toxin-antitoxin system antitoxin component (TIGR02293 family)
MMEVSMVVEIMRGHIYVAYRQHLEALLHIPVDASPQTIHELIETGFAAATVKALYDVGALAKQARDQIISPRTLKMRLTRAQRLTVAESDRLFRVVHILAMAETFFGDREKSKRWLTKPKGRLSGNSPVSLLSTMQGTRLVEEMLIQGVEGLAL